jgi:hypothetical protein
MTENTSTHLIVIVDRSGSMSSIRDDMVGGLQEFLDRQRELPGELTIDWVQFDDTAEFVHRGANAADVTVVLEPRGSTALYDAIGLALNDYSARYDAMATDARPTNVQVVIVTDGEENSSTEYSTETVRGLIGTNSARGFEFVYLGANQDAVLVARNIGIRADSAMSFAPRGAASRRSMEHLNRFTTDVRNSRRTGFTDDERETSMSDDFIAIETFNDDPDANSDVR